MSPDVISFHAFTLSKEKIQNTFVLKKKVNTPESMSCLYSRRKFAWNIQPASMKIIRLRRSYNIYSRVGILERLNGYYRTHIIYIQEKKRSRLII